jgi:hypothetical protein
MDAHPTTTPYWSSQQQRAPPAYPSGRVSECFYHYTRKEQRMADEALQAELERLRAENEALKGRAAKGMTLKVSEKGGVSVYGLGRFPVTLYKEQWERLLGMADDIRAFIAEHETALKTKEKEA